VNDNANDNAEMPRPWLIANPNAQAIFHSNTDDNATNAKDRAKV
jgi:hypothetical protein